MAACRANPTQGVFETLLVADGRPVELSAHLARLGASFQALYGLAAPAELGLRIADTARTLGQGRLRLTLSSAGDGTANWGLVTRPLEPRSDPDDGVMLSTHILAGGLGAHKWSDRSALPTNDDHSALLLDCDDAILESACANVFAVEKGTLRTPPLDGRILPGVTRAAILELAVPAGIPVQEVPLRREDLLAADEVFLSGSIRGIEAARSLDGMPLVTGGELTYLLSARLRERWGIW